MAGHRKTSGKPLRSEARRERSEAMYTDALAKAQTAAQRLGAAVDYARRELNNATTPHLAEQLATEAQGLLEDVARRATARTKTRSTTREEPAA